MTGRFSASEPNIHQLPREQQGRTSIRNLFVAGPGRRLIVADYDQIELRCAGFLSGDPEMIQVFIERPRTSTPKQPPPCSGSPRPT